MERGAEAWQWGRRHGSGGASMVVGARSWQRGRAQGSEGAANGNGGVVIGGARMRGGGPSMGVLKVI